MSVGDMIKKRRYELRMSQQELADAMGYKTRSTIAKIESGENDVSQKKLQRFAAALDTTVEDLTFGYAPVAARIRTSISVDDVQRNKNVVIILAGGKSGRNRQNIPSQFINVDGKPIIVYSMEVYQSHPMVDDIYVVCLRGWENILNAYARQYDITKLKGMVLAGNCGVTSLRNALDHIWNKYAEDDTVIVQEATRPMVSAEMVSTVLRACADKGSATVCHSMNDYVQFDLSGKKPTYVDRNSIIAMQTPEAHRFSLIKNVFMEAQRRNHPLTESCCTMLLYNLGYDINFVESSINNIKITREEDIAAFSALTKAMQIR